MLSPGGHMSLYLNGLIMYSKDALLPLINDNNLQAILMNPFQCFKTQMLLRLDKKFLITQSTMAIFVS